MDNVQPTAKAALRDMIKRGGGSSSGRLELSVQADPLIALASTVAMDVGQVRSDLASAVENIRHLPSKGFVVIATSTSVAVIGTIVIFADKLRALIGG